LKWISALDLEQWASQIGTRVEFPNLIRDLIWASAVDISEIRFPGGDKGQVPGFDGWLVASIPTPFVPAGRSIWEFGVGSATKKKFEDDYEKRKAEISESDRKEITFVFATLQTWKDPNKNLQEFVNGYRTRKDFKDVKFYDGTQIENWLEICSAVAAKYARTVCKRVSQVGARSTDEFWEEYSKRFRPSLTEDVVLCARKKQADQIVTHLLGKPGSLVFVADGPDEVTAVAVAAIRKAQQEQRAFLEARTLVVDSNEAGRQLNVANQFGFVVSPNANSISGMLSDYGPTVSMVGLNTRSKNYARLDRPSRREMAEALRTMGLSEEEASLLATKSGRSLTILERYTPAAGFSSPDWVDDGDKLIPALLAGAWDPRHDGDMAILSELGGGKIYLQWESSLRGFLDRPDPPLEREGGIWTLRAPVDAFVNLSKWLGDEHLELLASISVKIFSAPPPDSAEERFGVSKAPYSSWLRDGVANTLLMLAALHKEVRLEFRRDPRAFVEEVVTSLPGLRDDYRMILSLEAQLPILMEAAPDPLLSALEYLLEGNQEKIATIFDEKSDFGFPRNNLPELLWSLEMLAWDPRYLFQVCRILAQLSAIDPGGRSGNRPIRSLRGIFVAWSPGTNASLKTRLDVLDSIVRQVPAIGWNLLVQLLPKMSDMKDDVARPRFLEAGASEREVLTNSLINETYDAITDRVLEMLGNHAERWLAVIESFPRFSPDRKVQFLDLLEEFVVGVAGEDKVTLRRVVNDIIARHRRFRTAHWVLPSGDLNRLAMIAKSLDSEDPVDQARALFDEWMPFGSPDAADYVKAEEQLSQRRKNAVIKVAANGGPASVLDLAAKVRMPWLVAAAAVDGIEDNEQLVELLDKSPTTPWGDEFGIALAGSLRQRRGQNFDKQFLEIASNGHWPSDRIALFLLNWPNEETTWDLVKSLGDNAKELFWKRRKVFQFKGSKDQLELLVSNYLAVGRAGAALESIHSREDDLGWLTITRILEMRIRELNERSAHGNLDGYYVTELFKTLRRRNDIDVIDVANWEYAYFPILEYQDYNLVLFDLMASDPEFYISVLSDLFIEDDTNPDEFEPTDDQRKRAIVAYSVLRAFNVVPGQIDGIINRDELDRWVNGVIEKATEVRRLKVVYLYIGRVLAHSAEKDGIWPQSAVIDMIEQLKSEDLERGFVSERYNMRGVVSKRLFEGGAQENVLAQQYRDWANRVGITNQRTRSVLDEMVKYWEADAKREEEAAARDRLRFE